jgi:hypothetical protein
MSHGIKITAGEVVIKAELNDSRTAKAIIKSLPISSEANRWGGEIYFSIPVWAAPEKDSREVVQAGELGYWPTGSAFCIFFGPTPVSNEDEIRAASAVNIIGEVVGSLEQLWNVPDGTAITIEAD